MGAIVAILGEAGDPELAERLQRMLARSPYRGESQFLVEGPLAIGIQSMGWDASLHSAGNRLVAFHGYIGNWDELAAERGWRFPEHASNARKIAVAYEDLGDRLFARLRGEWAVLIWNRRERTLLAARDVVGCRPLFSHRHGNRVFLATEIRQALAGSRARASLNLWAPADYLLARFPEKGRTFFQGVNLLRGGVAETLSVDEPEHSRPGFEFWRPPPQGRLGRSSGDLTDELRALLASAVRGATLETGVAVALSGGLDSGSVWATLASQASPADLQSGKFCPYSNVYPGLPCDETSYIRAVHAFTGAEGVLIDTTGVRASDFLGALSSELDWPHLPNSFPLELICREASAHGHSVLFTGFGGDEWLHGSLDYVRELFFSGHILAAVSDLATVRLPSRQAGVIRKLRRLSPPLGNMRRLGLRRRNPRAMVVQARYREVETPIRGSWEHRVDGGMLPPSRRVLVRNLDRLAAFSLMEINDQQAARYGIELRHPLMNIDIVNFAFAVEPREFVAGCCYKRLLRKAMAGRLPGSVTGRVEPTVFNCLASRELDSLVPFPPGSEWLLARLGILNADWIDLRGDLTYISTRIIEMTVLLWVEEFVRRTFDRDLRSDSD